MLGRTPDMNFTYALNRTSSIHNRLFIMQLLVHDVYKYIHLSVTESYIFHLKSVSVLWSKSKENSG